MAAFRFLAVLCALPALAAAEDVVSIHADPPTLNLAGPDARYTLLVSGQRADGSRIDLTRTAWIDNRSGTVVRVTGNIVRAVGDGETRLTIEAAGRTIVVPVRVTGFNVRREYHFENDIVPLFSRYGCNSSGCHGKAEGQNGFKLSVFGFDPAADYAALVKEGRGRRVFAAAPEQSLFLRKAAGQVPHGGGTATAGRVGRVRDAPRLDRGRHARRPGERADRRRRIRVEPAERLLDMRAGSSCASSPATPTAARSTSRATPASSRTTTASPSCRRTGSCTSHDVPGEAAVMAAFVNEVDVFRALVPRAGGGRRSRSCRKTTSSTAWSMPSSGS